MHCIGYASLEFVGTVYKSIDTGKVIEAKLVVTKEYARTICVMAEDLAAIQRLDNKGRLLAEACLAAYPELAKDFNIC